MSDRRFMCTRCRESFGDTDAVRRSTDGDVEWFCPRCDACLSPLTQDALTVATVTLTKRVLLNGKAYLSLDSDDDVPLMELLGMLEYAKIMASERPDGDRS